MGGSLVWIIRVWLPLKGLMVGLLGKDEQGVILQHPFNTNL